MSKEYIAGWNMPGFMPDNEPCAFYNFEDAKGYVLQEAERYLESLEEEYDRGWPTEKKLRERMLEDIEDGKAALKEAKAFNEVFNLYIKDFVFWVSCWK